MGEHLHTIEQLRSKCIGFGIEVEQVHQLSERIELPAIMKHKIDCLYQTWTEINHEAALSELLNVVNAAGRVA